MIESTPGEDVEGSVSGETVSDKPAPGLTEAISTASGDILVTDAQKAKNGPQLLNYSKSEVAFDSIYAVSEQAYLIHLQQQLANFAVEARRHNPSEIAEQSQAFPDPPKTYGDVAREVEDFRENLIFINNAEFDHATDILAERLIGEAAAGNVVAIYEYRDRSPRYVATKVLQKVLRILDSPSNYSPDEGAVIKGRLLYDNDSERLAERATQMADTDHRRFYILDDFALSGTEIKQASIRLKGGLDKYQATDEVVGLTICSPSKKHPRVESIYKPPSKSANETGIAVAGSWSSTDYGYTDVLSRFNRLLATNSGMDRIRNMGVPPPSHQIKGRYNRGPDGQYLDPQYAEEYEQVKQAFGPHT